MGINFIAQDVPNATTLLRFRRLLNVHDVTVAAKLLWEDDEVVYRDGARPGLEKRDEIKQNPRLSSIEFHINRRPGVRARPLTGKITLRTACGKVVPLTES